MRLKKQIVLFACIIGVVVVTSACGSIDVVENSETTTDAAKDVSGGSSSDTSVYKEFIKERIDNKEKGEFSIKDIDNNNIYEVILRNQEKFEIYTYESGEMKEVDSEKFWSGTTRLYTSSNNKYPGIFYYYEGGGMDHYGYITISNGKVNNQILWDYDYSGISKELGEKRDKTVIYTEDKDIVVESKKLDDKDVSLDFYSLNDNNIDKIDGLIGK